MIDTVFSNAAKTSLLGRGDLSTGWALAWRLACWARLLDGNHAHKLLKNSLVHITSTKITYNEGGVYENLLNGPPFQIDGNFGITAGLTEMFLQSHLGKIQLLPAIPSAWPIGKISGIKAAGDFTLAINWESGGKTTASIHSGSGQNCKVYFPGVKNAILRDRFGKTVVFKIISPNEIEFKTSKNADYMISNLQFQVGK